MKNYLLDTHVLLWYLFDPEKLSVEVANLLENNEFEIYFSPINLWEISIKFGMGKLDLKGLSPDSFPDLCQKYNFKTLSLTNEIVASYHNLNLTFHKDPFDRMLIWQAICNNYTLISNDINMKPYQETGLKLLW